jgi:NAD(P)H-flavin reductase
MAATATESGPHGPMAPRAFTVRGRRRETEDTWTLELEPAGGGEPLSLAPGQFAMLYAFGSGEVPISVSGDVEGPLVHTVRAVGAVSQAICSARRGAVLGVRGPFGNAWPVEAGLGGDAIVIAGGIGSDSRRCGPSSASCCAGAATSARRSCFTAAAGPRSCSMPRS